MSSAAIRELIAICEKKIQKCEAAIRKYQALKNDVTSAGGSIKTAAEQYKDLIDNLFSAYQIDGGRPNVINKMQENYDEINLASNTTNNVVMAKINAKLASLREELAALQTELASLHAQLAAALAWEAEQAAAAASTGTKSK